MVAYMHVWGTHVNTQDDCAYISNVLISCREKGGFVLVMILESEDELLAGAQNFSILKKKNGE